MDGLRLLWVGHSSEPCLGCLDAVEQGGGWVSRVEHERLGVWRARHVDVVVVDATRVTLAELDDVLEVLHRHVPDVHVVVIAADIAAERHGVTMIRDDVGACERIVSAVALRRSRPGVARQAVRDARPCLDSTTPSRIMIDGHADTSVPALGVAKRKPEAHEPRERELSAEALRQQPAKDKRSSADERTSRTSRSGTQ